MQALTGFTLLLLCQSAGELLARAAGLPFPGPVIGLVLMAGLLRWPAVRPSVETAVQPLLGHLSLLFVPVGVGVIGHLGLIGRYGLQMMLALVISTWAGLLVAALVLRALLPREAEPPGAA